MSQDRPLRADAARKRAQILAAASDELAERAETADADRTPRLSLDTIAARAHVGIATLYRHFPSREALLIAVYRHELDRLCDAAPAMASAGPADAALLTWMTHYVDFVDSKRAMGEELGALVASGAITQVDTRARLAEAIDCFLRAGAEVDVFREDVLPDDVVAAMAGAVLAAVGERPHEQTQRLLGLLIDGLRRAQPSGAQPGLRTSR